MGSQPLRSFCSRPDFTCNSTKIDALNALIHLIGFTLCYALQWPRNKYVAFLACRAFYRAKPPI